MSLGLLNGMLEEMDKNGVRYVIYDGVQPNPTIDNIEEARKLYADKVDAWIGKEQIIVLTGQRRVGKSYILKDFMERHKADPQSNFIYINK